MARPCSPSPYLVPHSRDKGGVVGKEGWEGKGERREGVSGFQEQTGLEGRWCEVTAWLYKWIGSGSCVSDLTALRFDFTTCETGTVM
jgi:hypothetical protein